MKKHILFLCAILAFISSVAAQGFKNPVIPGFHPDPSICRVDSNYYLVNSTFEYFPGVPLFHSKDLINWQQIGHCLTRESQLPLEKCSNWGGIYAPTIRYYKGRFYMITTNVSGGGNFMVYTDDINSEWSDPIWINVPAIDPSLFFDDNKCYVTVNPENSIVLYEIDPETGHVLTEGHTIWNGTGGRYPEGPHIYKKDNWYYLLISEGGTEYGHKVTIARSRDIYGPYESNPANPILTHAGMIAQDNPIQGTGHADLIEAHDGSWWMVCLGFRPQSGRHHLLGRETFLAPVRWDKNAWPVVNGDGTIELEMNCPTLPLYTVEELPSMNNFNDMALGPEWNYLRNPNASNYSLTENPGYLRLKGTSITLDEIDSPTFVGRRQQDICFTAGTSVKLGKAQFGDKAGMTVFMKNNAHYDISVEEAKEKTQKVVLSYRLGMMQHIEKEVIVPNGTTWLAIQGDNNEYVFTYSTDGNKYETLGRMDTRYLSSESTNGFTGVYIGLFAVAPSKKSKSYVDFDYFIYLPQN